MKQTFVIFLGVAAWVSLTHGLFAQSLTQPNLPDRGFSFVYRVDTSQPQGFDWTDVIGLQNVNFEFVPADSSAHAESFPDADFAQRVPAPAGGINETFYEYNPDYFGFWGGVDGPTGIQVVHPEAVKYLPYPFSVGDLHQDNLTFEFVAGGEAITRDFRVRMEGLDVGVLQLPNGLSFDNAIRIDTRTVTTDSSETTVSEILTEGVQFWTQDMPLPVAQTYTYTQIMNGDSTVLFVGSEFVTEATVGFHLPRTEALFSAHPSPASHTLNVSGSVGSWVCVMDAQGRTLQRRQMLSEQERWDVSGWPVGMLFLNVEGTTSTQRVLITH